METTSISLEQYTKEVTALKEEITYLKEQLDWFKKQLFGQKAEKFVDTHSEEQLYFEGFDKIASITPAMEAKKPVKGYERRKRKPTGQDTISFPADVPIVRHILDLPEEEKICKETGEPLVKIGEEITSKLAYKAGSYFIKQIIRPKYASPKRGRPNVRVTSRHLINEVRAGFGSRSTYCTLSWGGFYKIQRVLAELVAGLNIGKTFTIHSANFTFGCHL